jgi:hypothetical protein
MNENTVKRSVSDPADVFSWQIQDPLAPEAAQDAGFVVVKRHSSRSRRVNPSFSRLHAAAAHEHSELAHKHTTTAHEHSTK